MAMPEPACEAALAAELLVWVALEAEDTVEDAS